MTKPSPQEYVTSVASETGSNLEALAGGSLAGDAASKPLGDLDLAAVLSLWESATDRLQRTQETLREEVHRLSEELEQKNRQLERKNRLADLGQIAAHIAHEVRNGLAPCTLYLSLLRRRLQADRANLEIVDKIHTCFQALETTVSDLLQFTADRLPRYEQVSVPEVVDELCQSLAPQFSAQRILPTVEVPRTLVVHADRTMLRRALMNLVLNAVDVMPSGGDLVITATATTSGATDVEVADSGPGIPEEIRRRMFEPFFTTKSQGTGLGLAIVNRIAEAHGGELQVANCPEGGAAFTLRIPNRSTQKEVA